MIKMQQIKVTKIFKWLCETNKRINLLVGGAGSSKSHSIAQFIIKKFYEEANTRILITRKTTPSLRISAYKLITDLLKEYGWQFGLNKTELVITQGSNEILFKGLDDPEKIKSADFNYVWAEEATDLTLEDYRQLNLRLRRKTDGVNQMFLTCNPISALHWIKTELADKQDIAINHSTYKDNPFLNTEYIAEIEDLINQDDNYYKIYALGEWGVLENIIYSKWQTLDEPEKFDDFNFGVDWGFNHPSVIAKIYWIDGKVVWHEMFYGGGLTQTELVNRALELIPPEHRRKEMFVDSAEPALVEELYRAGFNAQLAKKDVNDGISYCKTHLLGVTKSSTNGIKEIQGYSWKKDKNGIVIDEPVKFNDDFMDACRYGTYSKGANVKVIRNAPISFR